MEEKKDFYSVYSGNYIYGAGKPYVVLAYGENFKTTRSFTGKCEIHIFFNLKEYQTEEVDTSLTKIYIVPTNSDFFDLFYETREEIMLCDAERLLAKYLIKYFDINPDQLRESYVLEKNINDLSPIAGLMFDGEVNEEFLLEVTSNTYSLSLAGAISKINYIGKYLKKEE